MLTEEENMEQQLNIIFENAKLKAIHRISKKGNTAKPWEDFSIEHLKNRLDDEFDEWKKSGNSRELVDIINLCAFLKLAILYNKAESLFEGDDKNGK